MTRDIIHARDPRDDRLKLFNNELLINHQIKYFQTLLRQMFQNHKSFNNLSGTGMKNNKDFSICMRRITKYFILWRNNNRALRLFKV